MNRLQKKCLIATAGLHLLLVLVLLFGSAFFTHHEKPDDTQLLDVIPANLIDAAFSSGVKNAQPPAPTPLQPPQPVQQPPTPPSPPQPKPTPEPPKPLMQKVEEFFKPVPPKPTAEDPTPEPAPKTHTIKVNLDPVKRTVSKVTPDNSAEEAREAKRLRDQRAKAFHDAARSIKNNASSATTIEMIGTGSVSYANYGSAIKSIYEQAWNPPSETANDDANAKVAITIGSDGTVISARIINPSGDAQVDASVQRTLDSVTSVPAFPEGATEKQRTFKINFNLKAKRMLG